MLIGRPDVVEQHIRKLGLRIRTGNHFKLIDPQGDARHNTLIGAAMVRAGEADAMLCGTTSRSQEHMRFVSEQVGLHEKASIFATLNILLLPGQTLFICDTHINLDPNAEQVTEMTLLAAEEVRRFGITPKVALLSHSNFGGFDDASARKMSRARELLEQRAPDLEVDGEMHADAAVSEKLRKQLFPDSRLKGAANLLIMPNLDAANISFNLLKMIAGDGITIGPILLGAAKSVHIMTPSSTVRRIVNMSALAVAGAMAH
ncbi:MAG: phosphate acyltransferase [Bryobacteraceae bacterium]